MQRLEVESYEWQLGRCHSLSPCLVSTWCTTELTHLTKMFLMLAGVASWPGWEGATIPAEAATIVFAMLACAKGVAVVRYPLYCMNDNNTDDSPLISHVSFPAKQGITTSTLCVLYPQWHLLAKNTQSAFFSLRIISEIFQNLKGKKPNKQESEEREGQPKPHKMGVCGSKDKEGDSSKAKRPLCEVLPLDAKSCAHQC